VVFTDFYLFDGLHLDVNCIWLLVKGKAIPLQEWTGPEGSRWLRLLDFMTIGT